MSPPFFGLGEGIVSIPITLVPSNNSRTAISLVINCPGKEVRKRDGATVMMDQYKIFRKLFWRKYEEYLSPEGQLKT